jgi:hypothetical protein
MRSVHGSIRLGLAVVAIGLVAAQKVPPPRYVETNNAGRLVYAADARGNRMPDFSRSGYGGGGLALPDAPVRVVVSPGQGDNGSRIQAAIDHVARQPADSRGIRGAVLLLVGRHEIAGQIRLNASGVVLRGQGDGPSGTILFASGTDRRNLIQIASAEDRPRVSSATYRVADPYVPVGATQLRLDRVEGLKVGDPVFVDRPSPSEWIAEVGMDRFPPGYTGSWLDWQPGKMDLRFDREIVAIDPETTTVTLDAPITTALDASVGGGSLSVYSWPGRIEQVGVENLRCESAIDPANPLDEQHSWEAIDLKNARNAWVRQVSAVHFAGSAVSVREGCKWVTVQDCQALRPVSEDGGYRRHTFSTSGQLTLFQRCRSEQGRHDFAVGFLATGPNVFLDCEATGALGFSGPIESWASGVLYDNITMDGGGLALTNREIDGHGIGWAAANSVLWQCTAPVITCRQPPGARNWAIGCWGQFIGDGSWQAPNEFVKPDSLYRAQLAERLGARAVANLERREIPNTPGEARSVDEIVPPTAREAAGPGKPLALQNGWLVADGKLLTGGRTGTTWWRGDVLPSRVGEFGIGLTRFVPGKVGDGYTDDLDRLTDRMRQGGTTILEHHWGLWYDRRRDDHEMIRRIDGEVWPPFYEQPWARSGQGKAWDGLSKYDLTAFNPWYFDRLRQFASLCDEKGLVLLHEAYFQHNILEAGAHWADFPWRPANCLQATGFPEPPPYENKKRVFMADAFYDVTHPVRRDLHRRYIRHCLDMLGDRSNVIYLTGDEYTGPLEFVRFWLDTVTDWERETGKDVLVGLSCTKDVQDAILADPARGPSVSVIEMKYWWYASDGTPYAPEGGRNLAPRQHWREWKGTKSRSADQTARQVREYRDRYPDKAILSEEDQGAPWAVLAAGGSIPKLPRGTAPELLAALPRMKPSAPAGLNDLQWALADPGRDYLVYASSGRSIRLDLPAAGETFSARWIDPRTGQISRSEEGVQGGTVVDLPIQGTAPAVLWVTRDPNRKDR